MTIQCPPGHDLALTVFVCGSGGLQLAGSCRLPGSLIGYLTND